MNKTIISIVTLLFAINLNAQTSDSLQVQNLQEVVIQAERKALDYSSKTASKIPLKNIENPQVYNSISKYVIKDQLSTSFQAVLNNATGVSRLWESTGRAGDGAEYYTMRGFSVQPTLVNGMPNVNNFVEPNTVLNKNY